MFYALFLGDCCLGKQCYEHCKYKYDKSSADIRIGDLWGKTYKDNEDGVSAAIAFTKQGDEILKACNCELVEHPFEVVAEGQMKTCPLRIGVYGNLMVSLKDETQSIEDAARMLSAYKNKQRQLNRVKHPLNTIRNVIKKMKR